MKKQPVNWEQVLGRLLETGIGGVPGGFRVDENGRLVEDYAQADGDNDAAAYLAQLKRSGTLPAETDADEEDDDLFAAFGLPSAGPAEME